MRRVPVLIRRAKSTQLKEGAVCKTVKIGILPETKGKIIFTQFPPLRKTQIVGYFSGYMVAGIGIPSAGHPFPIMHSLNLN